MIGRFFAWIIGRHFSLGSAWILNYKPSEKLDFSLRSLTLAVCRITLSGSLTKTKYTGTIYSTRSLHFCNDREVSEWFQKSFLYKQFEDFGIFSLGDVEHPTLAIDLSGWKSTQTPPHNGEFSEISLIFVEFR